MSVDKPVFTDLFDNNLTNSGHKEFYNIQLHLMTQGRNELIQVMGTILDLPVTILINSASSHNLISTKFISQNNLQDLLVQNIGTIEMGNGSLDDSSYWVHFPYKI